MGLFEHCDCASYLAWKTFSSLKDKLLSNTYWVDINNALLRTSAICIQNTQKGEL